MEPLLCYPAKSPSQLIEDDQTEQNICPVRALARDCAQSIRTLSHIDTGTASDPKFFALKFNSLRVALFSLGPALRGYLDFSSCSNPFRFRIACQRARGGGMSVQRLLVVGGNGFIGRYFLPAPPAHARTARRSHVYVHRLCGL